MDLTRRDRFTWVGNPAVVKEFTMSKITVSFEVESEAISDQLMNWLYKMLAEVEAPVAVFKDKRKTEKRKPMEEGPKKAALLKRLAKGRAKSAAEVAGIKFNEAKWETNYDAALKDEVVPDQSKVDAAEKAGGGKSKAPAKKKPRQKA